LNISMPSTRCCRPFVPDYIIFRTSSGRTIGLSGMVESARRQRVDRFRDREYAGRARAGQRKRLGDPIRPECDRPCRVPAQTTRKVGPQAARARVRAIPGARVWRSGGVLVQACFALVRANRLCRQSLSRTCLDARTHCTRAGTRVRPGPRRGNMGGPADAGERSGSRNKRSGEAMNDQTRTEPAILGQKRL
jgi:hypothetical protein